jgi:hypothetical protein
MRKAPSVWLSVAILISSLYQPTLAKDIYCDEQSKKGDICICKISDLHPTQGSVGMAEVRIKAEKLKSEFQRRSESDFLNYLRKHNKEEPVTIGPQGIFYITDHHHLARALYDIGVSNTYCTIIDNLSHTKPYDFWKQLEANNEVYLKDRNGNPITPHDLPTSVKDLSNNPVRGSCGFEKGDESSSGENYLEFQWADYLRAHWAQTGIASEDIDTKFEGATIAALQLAAQKDAANLPGYTGKVSCD